MPHSAPSPAKPPGPRLGPRPLPLNLMTAANLYLSSNAALPLLRSGSLSWSPSLEKAGKNLLDALPKANPEDFAARVERLSRSRAAAFLTGLERYRHHPYHRALSDPPALWSDGATRLLDYGGDEESAPVILIPSLINRHYILDLNEDRSFVRWLAGEGFRPFVVDWGLPGPEERSFTLSDYILRLEPALDRITDATDGAPISVVGYCMGGLLAMSLALRNREMVNALVLLATPWDFHADAPEQAEVLAQIGAGLEPTLRLLGELPVDVLQMLFSALDPLLVERKFVSFAAQDPEASEAVAFVALEDWVNDGVPLAAPVARECFADWYGANSPARGAWMVDGDAVDPAQFDRPALVVIPSADRIVPPKSAAALGAALPQAALLEPDAGHIGMMVGGRAHRKMWRPVADWLAGRV